MPHANLVGEVNKGHEARGRRAFGDFELAANALGVCDAAFDMAREQAKCALARRRATSRQPDGPVEALGDGTC